MIDATEGGVEKKHAHVRTLAEAMAPHAQGPSWVVPVPAMGDRGALGPALARLRDVRAGVWKIAEHTKRSKEILEEMIEHADDQPRVNGLIREVHGIRDEVKAIQPAWELVMTINQRGTFNRARADREIHLAGDSPLDRQKAQMRRDAEKPARADRRGRRAGHADGQRDPCARRARSQVRPRGGGAGRERADRACASGPR